MLKLFFSILLERVLNKVRDMVRRVDYETRRRAVLGATIRRYIKCATPISSEEIAGEFALSSATIRNIFSNLEQEGYLTHPHTSAGRIPTDKSYRYYVDLLSSQIGLMQEEKNSIINHYERQIKRLEDALELTSDIISELTHCAGIVSSLEEQSRFFCRGVSFMLEQPEFQDYQRIRSLIKMLEEKERILGIINRDFQEKVRVYIGQELGCAEMDSCALVVSRYCVNKRPSGRMAVLGPARMEYAQVIPILEYISDVLSGVLDKI